MSTAQHHISVHLRTVLDALEQLESLEDANSRLDDFSEQLKSEQHTLTVTLYSILHRAKTTAMESGLTLSTGRFMRPEHVSAYIDFADDMVNHINFVPVEFKYEENDDSFELTPREVVDMNDALYYWDALIVDESTKKQQS